MFFLQIYNLVLKENTLKGSIITTVKATDLDEGEFGEISYYIPQERNSLAERELISVDPSSGEVRLLQTLDREAIDRYELYVNSKTDAINQSFILRIPIPSFTCSINMILASVTNTFMEGYFLRINNVLYRMCAPNVYTLLYRI